MYINLGLRGTGRSSSTQQHGCLVIFHSCCDPPLALFSRHPTSLPRAPPSPLRGPPGRQGRRSLLNSSCKRSIHPCLVLPAAAWWASSLWKSVSLYKTGYCTTRLYISLSHKNAYLPICGETGARCRHAASRWNRCLPCLVRFIRSFSCIVGILRSTCFLAAVLASCKKILLFTLFNLIRTLNRKFELENSSRCSKCNC